MNRDSRLQARAGPSSPSVSHAAPESGAPRGSWFERAGRLTRETVDSWIDDNATRLAAALAYYTLLSLAPLVVLAIALAGLEFGEDAAKGQIAFTRVYACRYGKEIRPSRNAT